MIPRDRAIEVLKNPRGMIQVMAENRYGMTAYGGASGSTGGEDGFRLPAPANNVMLLEKPDGQKWDTVNRFNLVRRPPNQISVCLIKMVIFVLVLKSG